MVNQVQPTQESATAAVISINTKQPVIASRILRAPVAMESRGGSSAASSLRLHSHHEENSAPELPPDGNCDDLRHAIEMLKDTTVSYILKLILIGDCIAPR